MTKKQLIDIVSACIVGAMSNSDNSIVYSDLKAELTDLICPNGNPTEEMLDMINSLIDHIGAIRLGRRL